MRSVRLGWLEIKRLLRRRLVRAALLAIVLVPLLYGALYLWAFWDPYGRVDQMPVALVNLDRPAQVDGEVVDVGKSLTASLRESSVFDWEAASPSQAAQGLEDGTYYLSVTIPSDFSARLASVTVEDPRPAAIQVALNPASNYLASTIGRRVLSEVRAAAAQGVAADYFDRIFVGLSDVQGQVQEAADGADRLSSGLAKAADGGSALASGLGSAEDGSWALATGLGSLGDGSGQLAGGATEVADGAGTLAGSLVAATEGAQDLASGGGDLASGARSLAGGASQVSDAVREAVAQVSEAASASSQLSAGADDVLQALEAIAAANPALASDPTFQAALAGSQQLAAGVGDLAGGLASAGPQGRELVAGAQQLAAGTRDLAEGAASLGTGASRLATGLARATDGASRLAAGAGTVAEGAAELQRGAARAEAGSADLSDGLVRLSAGADRLGSALVAASGGSQELWTGLAQGASAIPAYDDADRQQHAETMSNPVLLSTSEVRSVPNYGTGLSPYFIALGLWVGAVLAFYLLRPLAGRILSSALPNRAVALSGFWAGALVVALQAVILVTVVVAALGLSPANTVALYAFTVLAALSFAAIVQWLVAAFGSVGKFLAIALLMLQVTSAAGTFPIETAPAFFRAISPLLPMTHVIIGLRQAISGGDMAALGRAALLVAAYGLAGLVLTTLTVRRNRQWRMERLHPALEI